MRKTHDRRCHILHLQSAVLRAHGDHLEEPEAALWLPQDADGVRHQDIHRYSNRMHRNCHSKPGRLHLLSRSCLPLNIGTHIPRSYRTGDLLRRTWMGHIQLATMEELVLDHLWRRWIPHGHIRQYRRNCRYYVKTQQFQLVPLRNHERKPQNTITS